MRYGIEGSVTASAPLLFAVELCQHDLKEMFHETCPQHSTFDEQSYMLEPSASVATACGCTFVCLERYLLCDVKWVCTSHDFSFFKP